VVDYRGVRERVNVTIEDGTITRVGGEVEGDEVDCSDLVVMPGLVNSHTHASMLALRGYFDDGELEDWLKRMWEAEDKFTDELMYVSAELAVIEMLSSGPLRSLTCILIPTRLKI
jgi:Cytosine deaminase and related metal-dependent hydrolases